MIDSMSALPALSLNKGEDAEKYRKVKVVGHYLQDETFLIDNMIHDRHPGYHAVSILVLSNTEELILVNRGWVAGLADRRVLPKVNTPEGRVSLEGTLVSPKERPSFMGDGESQEEALRLYIDLDKISKRLNKPVAPFVMQMTDGGSDGFIRAWPKFDAKVSMHIGYAIQWFAFSFCGFSTAVYFCFKKKKPV